MRVSLPRGDRVSQHARGSGKMNPKPALWKLEPHTRGKHLVLKNYLDAWIPILGRTSSRILFIDGFAGPGEYEGGEEGSPIIALRALNEHRAKGQILAQILFIFIEKDERRAKHLDNLVDEWKVQLPPNCRIWVVHGVFDETMTQVLDELDARSARLAPCFVMVDPFGVSETPMSVIRRFFRNPKSEVYVSFMYEYINRFKRTPEFEPHLDQLFGCREWRKGIRIRDSEERRQFFCDLYRKQLREAGAKHVVRFDLCQGRRVIYTVFFGTQHHTGCDRMKRAIWKVAPFGDYAFRAYRLGQLTLELKAADFEPLREALKDEFCGREWVTIEEVHDFVASDRTHYHTGQVRRGALIPMEESHELEVQADTRARRRTYPKGTRLRFL
jgi:three-Cys-motif partner protein